MPVNIPESLKPSGELVILVRQLNLMPLKKWSARDIRALHGFATLHTSYRPPADEAYSDRRCNVNYVVPKKPRTLREKMPSFHAQTSGSDAKFRTYAREVLTVTINRQLFARIYKADPGDQYWVKVDDLVKNSLPMEGTRVKTMAAAKNEVQHWAFDLWRLSERVMRSDE